MKNKKPVFGEIYTIFTKKKSHTYIPKNLEHKLRVNVKVVYNTYSLCLLLEENNPELIAHYGKWENVPTGLKDCVYIDHRRIGTSYILHVPAPEVFPIW